MPLKATGRTGRYDFEMEDSLDDMEKEAVGPSGGKQPERPGPQRTAREQTPVRQPNAAPRVTQEPGQAVSRRAGQTAGNAECRRRMRAGRKAAGES